MTFNWKPCGLMLATLIGATGAASAQQPREVIMGLSSTSFGTAAARIAKEMGFFEKYGVNPKMIVLDSGSAATAALIGGSVQVALSGNAEAIFAQSRGQKVVVVSNTYSGLASTLVLNKDVAAKLGVSADAPIGARLKALDGLVIGSPSATSSATLAFKNAASANGANVRFTFMAQPAMVAALETGAIQGFAASAPFWAAPIVKGSGVLWVSGPKNELPPENTPASSGAMQTMRAFADANPDLIKALASGFEEVGKAIVERPAEVKAVVAKLYPELSAETLDLVFGPESNAWKVKALSKGDIEHEIAFMKAVGMPLPPMDGITPASILYP